MKFPCFVQVIDCQGEPVEISFKEFTRLPLRNILNPASEFLLELDDGSMPILVATGDKMLKMALRMRPERALPFHEVLTALILHWTSDMMDKPLIDLPIRCMSNTGASEAITRTPKMAAIQREVTA